MKLLLTGAIQYSNDQLKEIQNLGFETVFVQYENETLPLDITLNVQGVICNSLFLKNDIQNFKNLKFIQAVSAGLDRLPMDYIQDRGISIKNAHGVYSIPMAEWALSQILSIYKSNYFFHTNQMDKVWEKKRDLKELNGQTAVIVGFGNVGQEIAKRLSSFGVNILATDIYDNAKELRNNFYHISELEIPLGMADIIVLALPLTKETEHIFNKDMFSKVKKGAGLINISRGGVICETALIDAISGDILSWVSLDVFTTEPLDTTSPLWDMKNVYLTPHNSFVSDKNKDRLFKLIIQNLKDAIKNEIFTNIP